MAAAMAGLSVATTPAEVFRRAREGDYSFLAEQVDAGRVYVDVTDELGNTLLMTACIAGHKKVARVLLRRGADVNAANSQGQTALHYCLGLGHTELGDYLIARGANDEALNAAGRSCYEGL